MTETKFAIKENMTSAVYDVADVSPLLRAPILSERSGNEIWLKREDLQPVNSFKLRGAYNKMVSLSAETLAKGVVAASAGNHAQGVALAAKKLGINATIVVPRTAPQIKQDAINRHGAELVLAGDTYEEAYAHALKLASEHGQELIHPYDDPLVIAGQGTIGTEIDEQHHSKIDAVFVPVGGGGLLAGIALELKRRRPEIKIIGVEPTDSDAMKQSIAKGYRVKLDHVGALADGVAVKQVGELTFEICREWVDEFITVTPDEICAAVKDIFEDSRAILEPSGALAYAGIAKYGGKNQTYIAICTGANLNFERLRYISERAELGGHREAIFAIHIPEKPGEFRKLCQAIGGRSITEFNYRMNDPNQATVFVGVRITSEDDKQEILSRLFDAVDLSDDELAKTHVRHMVGGRSPHAKGEKLVLFDFPERAGALSTFLECLADNWNISLFHYRNSGGDQGKVLAGFQVPTADQSRFDTFCAELGYPYRQVSDSPAARFFLE
ncbi:threonine ammonia-lyase, biosynthetic [soil metagenome]